MPRAMRRAALLLGCLGGLAALAACSGPPAKEPVAMEKIDPVLLGHAAWCDQNPPSGYCITRHRR